MTAPASIFFDLNLPNATSWFYFSWLLAMALFFKFSRLLSVRNWDVVTLFVLVPGLLLLQEARPTPQPLPRHPAVTVASVIGAAAGNAVAGPGLGLGGVGGVARVSGLPASPSSTRWVGYLWLLCGSLYFLLRCLLDLALVRRPALAPNLNFGGLAWFAGALFICMIAVAFRHPAQTQGAAEDNPQRQLAPAGTTMVSGPSAPSEGPQSRQSVPLDLVQRLFSRGPFWLPRAFALLCHLSVIAGLIVIGARYFQDASAGMAAAMFYLLLPYTGQFVGELMHVWPMALMIWALPAYRLPTLCGVVLGLAAGTVFFPALVLPVWVSFYWGRGAGRFMAAFLLTAGLCLAYVGLDLWLSDDLSPVLQETFRLSAWQAWRLPRAEGFWTGVHWAYRMPVFIAYLAFLLAVAFWPAPKNLAHVIALSAASLIGIQFWYADQGGIYVLWYLPLLLLLVFRPNLADRRPLPIQAETDWLVRSRRALVRLVAWLIRVPEPASR